MPSRALDFPVFDVDNHMYETPAAMTKHIDPKFKGVIDYVDVEGRTKIAVKGRVSEYIPNPTFAKVAAPGAQEEYFRSGNPEGKSRREILGKAMVAPPAFREPGPRIELMDEQGIDRALMWPTLASLVEERLRDRAIAELEWVLERGAKVILIRPAPVPGVNGMRSFALPEFDPFWERVEATDIVVGMHASDSGYQRYMNDWEGVTDEMKPFVGQTGFGAIVGHTSRPIIDTVASAIGHGMCSRFPKLKIALVENGPWSARHDGVRVSHGPGCLR